MNFFHDMIVSHSDRLNLFKDPLLTRFDVINDNSLKDGYGNILSIKFYASNAIPGRSIKDNDGDGNPYWTEEKLGKGVKRLVPLFDRNAVILGIWKNIKKEVNFLDDNTMQLTYAMKMGATRINEKLVAKICVGETAGYGAPFKIPAKP
ncbi:hypothetical protein HUT03_04380 [Candidatus Liberibacter africanus]|nr:phage capsid protein [Candidatus Liberibacter africanus]QTP64196.1 hypothetical protein HUT03_04380 [Candidatus Liberibacter africanus]